MQWSLPVADLCAVDAHCRGAVAPSLECALWLVSLTALGAAQHEKFQSAPGSRVGTPAYLAPEVIMTTKGQTYDGKVCPTHFGGDVVQLCFFCYVGMCVHSVTASAARPPCQQLESAGLQLPVCKPASGLLPAEGPTHACSWRTCGAAA